MVGFNYIGIFQVGDSATHLKYAMEGTGSKVKLLRSRLQEALGGFFRSAKLPYPRWYHLSIAG
jgi:hypothetical protein